MLPARCSVRSRGATRVSSNSAAPARARPLPRTPSCPPRSMSKRSCQLAARIPHNTLAGTQPRPSLVPLPLLQATQQRSLLRSSLLSWTNPESAWTPPSRCWTPMTTQNGLPVVTEQERTLSAVTELAVAAGVVRPQTHGQREGKLPSAVSLAWTPTLGVAANTTRVGQPKVSLSLRPCHQGTGTSVSASPASSR